MKVLILSCKTGEGHNSAAEAMKEAFERKGIYGEIVDPVSFGGENAKKAVSSIYNSIIKNVPVAFGAIYKAGEIYDSTGLPSPIYFANSLYAEKLNKYITENRFDTVVCTHLYGMEAMTAIRKKYGFSVPCYGVLTDYTCIPFMGDTKLRYQFVPHEDIKKELIAKGIPKERICVTGIPVSGAFNEHMEKDAARECLNIPKDKKVVLVMTGGEGCGKIYELCTEFEKINNNEFMVYVMTGHNNEMKQQLERNYGINSPVVAVPFTKQVSTYMNAADVLITKPGGLSSTEAAVACIPMVQLMTIPGCETKNAEFFENHGMAVRANSVREAVYSAKMILCDGEMAERMKAMQRSCINPNAADDIVEQIINS